MTEHEHDLAKVAELHISPVIMFEIQACRTDYGKEMEDPCMVIAVAPTIPEPLDGEDKTVLGTAMRTLQILEMVSLLGTPPLSAAFALIAQGLREASNAEDRMKLLADAIAQQEMEMSPDQTEELRRQRTEDAAVGLGIGSHKKEDWEAISEEEKTLLEEKEKEKEEEIKKLDDLFDGNWEPPSDEDHPTGE